MVSLVWLFSILSSEVLRFDFREGIFFFRKKKKICIHFTLIILILCFCILWKCFPTKEITISSFSWTEQLCRRSYPSRRPCRSKNRLCAKRNAVITRSFWTDQYNLGLVQYILRFMLLEFTVDVFLLAQSP